MQHISPSAFIFIHNYPHTVKDMLVRKNIEADYLTNSVSGSAHIYDMIPSKMQKRYMTFHCTPLPRSTQREQPFFMGLWAEELVEQKFASDIL